MVLAGITGMSIMAMVLITCLDVILRLIGRPLLGAYDLVYISGAVATACALPYTTALKGHVAIEYFFHKLGRRGRIVVDSAVRILGVGLFAVLTWQSALIGHNLRIRGEVTATLQVPIFWVSWLISLCCGMMVLIILYNLLHPGKELLKP